MDFNEFLADWDSETETIEVRTSGSTGKPKRLLLPKAMMRASAMRTIRFFGLNTRSRLHSCVAADFIGGKMVAVRARLCGAAFSWETPSNHPQLEAPHGAAITLASVVPSQMVDLVRRAELPRVEQYLVGGAPVSPALAGDIAQRGITAYESYGMTETASHVALRRIGAPDTVGGFRPLPGISVSLTDDSRLRIDHEFGSLVTNDLAELNEDGTFVITGRADSMINSGGRKINPIRLERLIGEALPGTELTMTSEPDPLWGERVVLLLEGQGLEQRAREAVMRLREAGAIAPWETPKAIRCTPRLPRTPNGKIRRKISGND